MGPESSYVLMSIVPAFSSAVDAIKCRRQRQQTTDLIRRVSLLVTRSDDDSSDFKAIGQPHTQSTGPCRCQPVRVVEQAQYHSRLETT